MSDYLVIIIGVAASYYFYNYQFIRFSSHLLGWEKGGALFIGGISITNYAIFILLSVSQFHLVVNWTVFWVFLMLEIWVYYRRPFSTVLYLSLVCVMLGLAINIFMRCSFSLFLDVPLSAFDNQVAEMGNMKQYPVFLGFLLTGMVFWQFNRIKLYENMKVVIQDRPSLHFTVMLMFILYGFLVLNLVAYYEPGGFGMKIWGIKSAVFALAGSYLANYYTCQMSQLNLYRVCNQNYRKEQLEQREEEERLKLLAFSDALTGCYNRHYLAEVWDHFEQKNGSYSLCLTDLDGLKRVNDTHGHQEGDGYLMAAVQAFRDVMDEGDILIRYGGDEFLLLFAKAGRDECTVRMEAAAVRLAEYAKNKWTPYPMTFCYGVAENKECMEYQDLLKLVDSRVYQQKEEKHSRRR